MNLEKEEELNTNYVESKKKKRLFTFHSVFLVLCGHKSEELEEKRKELSVWWRKVVDELGYLVNKLLVGELTLPYLHELVVEFVRNERIWQLADVQFENGGVFMHSRLEMVKLVLCTISLIVHDVLHLGGDGLVSSDSEDSVRQEILGVFLEHLNALLDNLWDAELSSLLSSK